MNEGIMNGRSIAITEYFEKYSKEKIERLEIVRDLIHDNSSEISEKMWSKVPCFYNDKINIVLVYSRVILILLLIPYLSIRMS